MLVKPDFERMVAAVRELAFNGDVEAVHLVCKSAVGGGGSFVALPSQGAVRLALEEALRAGVTPLGLLAWRETPVGWQPIRGLFPWVGEATELSFWFDEFCEKGVASVNRNAGEPPSPPDSPAN